MPRDITTEYVVSSFSNFVYSVVFTEHQSSSLFAILKKTFFKTKARWHAQWTRLVKLHEMIQLRVWSPMMCSFRFRVCA
jgi:hypothetical protein